MRWRGRSAVRGRALGGVVVTAMVVALLQLVPSWAADYTLGVDVSHWQRTIAWGKVAASGHLFAYQKATEGVSYTDPTYETNRNGATSHGIKFGAYHFSNPQGDTATAAKAEAKQEADHFVDFAQPAPGDLIPALDIESSSYTQAMPTARLIKWVDAWLQEVELRVGVKPVIYTSVYFWKTKFGDTSHFAQEGYPLWLARWTSASQPGVPAQDWGGSDWTFWQWTDCAKVAGIDGCVDEDRYRGSDFTPVTIPGGPLPTPTPTVSAIPPSNSSPPVITGDATVDSTLTATKGTWQGSEPIAYAYAWYRCDGSGGNCSGIAGGTGPTYRVTPDDYGFTLKVTVTATNSGGSSSASSDATPIVTDTAAPPAPVMTALASTSAVGRLKLAWDDTDSGARTFDLRQRTAAFDGAFGSYEDLVTRTTTRVERVPLVQGHTYCFSARARDEADNASTWSEETCTIAPVDDRNLEPTGAWTRASDPAAYRQTYSQTTRRHATLALAGGRGNRVALVAQKCPGCGRVRVSVDGRAIKDVSLAASATENRVVIPIASFGRVKDLDVSIKVISSGRTVRIDGLAVGRVG